MAIKRVFTFTNTKPPGGSGGNRPLGAPPSLSAPYGVAQLNPSGKIDPSQLPEFVCHFPLPQAWGEITWETYSGRKDLAGCNHDLKEYVGFSESYKYCIHCDHKESV